MMVKHRNSFVEYSLGTVVKTLDFAVVFRSKGIIELNAF